MQKTNTPKNKSGLGKTQTTNKSPSVEIVTRHKKIPPSFAVFVGIIIVGVVLTNYSAFVLLSGNRVLAGNVVRKPQKIKEVMAPSPIQLNIPNLKLSAKFEQLGINADGTIEVPKNAMSVGWFMHGAKPGEIGPTIVIGHLDSAKGPAIFVNLNKLAKGDIINIRLSDGTIITYKVDSLSKFPQNNFPTKAVYGPLSYSGIRLITCAGSYDKKTKHYKENLIVFGTKI